MSKKVITGPAVLSYPHFADAQLPLNGIGKAKFSASLVFLPGADISALEKAVVEAAVEKWGNGAIARLKSGALKQPIRRDAEAKGYPEGSVFTNVRSEQRPGLVYLYPDESGKPALVIPGLSNPEYDVVEADKDKIKRVFYAGATVRASITAFAYDRPDSKGVSFGLNNVQLLDGTTPRLDGRKSATDEFEADESMKPADLSDLENGGDVE